MDDCDKHIEELKDIADFFFFGKNTKLDENRWDVLKKIIEELENLDDEAAHQAAYEY